MTADKPISPYRKVWVPTEIRDALIVYGEAHDIQLSPLVTQVIEEIVDDPKRVEDRPIPPAGPNYISLYVSPELWAQGVAVASEYGVTLGAMIRVGLALRLAEDGIPWDVTTPRPRRGHIPVLE
jgi:antitoxin component of RelBE/YafQ-DinJ toxin-antitoxin module